MSRTLVVGVLLLSVVAGCLGGLQTQGSEAPETASEAPTSTTTLGCENRLYVDRVFDVRTNDTAETTVYEFENDGRTETATAEEVLDYRGLDERRLTEFDGALNSGGEAISRASQYYWNEEVALVSKNSDYYVAYASAC